MSDSGHPPSGGEPDPTVPPPDPSGPPTEPLPATEPSMAPTEPVPTTPSADLPPTLPPTAPGGLPPGAVPPGGGVPPDGTVPPEPPDGPWYENRTALAVAVVTGLALLFLLVSFFIWWGSGGDDDSIEVGPIVTGTVIGSGTAETTTTSIDDTTTTVADDTTTTEDTTTTTSTTTTTTTTTTTEVPTTTAAPTTTPATTTTIPEIVVPPQPSPTAWDIIVNSPDLGRARELFEIAELDSVLADPNLVLTVFVPTDEAIENAAGGQGAPDLSDPAVVGPILEAHLHLGTAYETLAGLTEIEVLNGGPQPVTANPPTFGSTPRPANVVVSATSPSNGVIHVVDQVVAPQP